MIHRSNLELIVEDWYDIALRMKNDEKANKAFGWILEMVRFISLTVLAITPSRQLSSNLLCGCAVCICHCIFASPRRAACIQAAW